MFGYSRSKASDTDLQPEMVAHLAGKRQRAEAQAEAKAAADRKTASDRAAAHARKTAADRKALAKAIADELESRNW